jgi:imidazolonepropionase-like amidohydrolase
MRAFLVACMLMACTSIAFSQDILIRGATVHTMSKQGTLANTDVLIRNGKIAAVGTGLNTAADATTIDAKGRPLTPGMFGGLTGIGIEEISAEPATSDNSVAPKAAPFEMEWRPEFDVTLAYNPRSVLVPVTRIEGFTWTVLTPGTTDGGNFLAGQGAAVTLDGSYDSVLDGSRSLFINLGGEMNAYSEGSRAAQWMLLEQAIRETYKGAGEDKHALLHPLGREAFSRYLKGGRVVFHVSRASDIRRTVAFAKRNGMKPVIAGGEEAWLVAEELAREDVPVLLNALANLPSTFDQLGSRLDNAALLNKAGVRIAFTQFGESHNARKVRQLAGNAVAQGLPKEVALAGLTAQPAEIFGLADHRGHIAPGQVADVVLWSGDPLEVTSAADQVWIGGRAIRMSSRQTELRDRYLERLRGAK